MTNSKIIIDKIKENDLDEIIKLGLTTKELAVGDTPEYYTKDELRAFIKSPDDIYLTARVNRKLTGYLLATYNKYLKEAYLIDIVIKKTHRGKGLATLLFDEIIAELQKRNCSWAWSIVRENNQKMTNLLEKRGFIKGKKFYCYYKNFK